MRRIRFFPFFIIVFISTLTTVKGFGQTSATDYFRSAQSGSWGAASSWESSPDGLANWVLASSAPNFNANTIIIKGGDTITIINSITIDQAVIANGGVLNLATGSSSLLTINDGPGNDIIVQDGGIFKHNVTGNVLPTFNGLARLEIQHGGILEAATNNGNASNYAIPDSMSNVLWNDGSIFSWNNISKPTPSVTYFPALPAIPVFRFTKPTSVGGLKPTVINGLLEAIADVEFASGGTKTFRNGIIGTGKVAASSVSSGKFIINGLTAILGGTGQVILGKGLIINSGTMLTLTSDKKIDSFNAKGSSNNAFINAGILIAGNYIISGTSKVQIDGTVRTTNASGLSGGATTTFATSAEITLNSAGSSSVVEYSRVGDQIVTPLTYNKVIISGGGTKTVAPGSDIYVSDSLNIMPGCTFALNGINNLKLNGGGTANINTNAIFDNVGESEVSGGSSPKINVYGTFVTRNAKGLSGSSGTSIPGATAQSPTIALNIYSGSTIEYGKSGDQDVTSRDDYKNITFSGSGVKSIPTCRPIGTVTIKDNVTADASNKTFGDTTATNLMMTGGRFKVGGIGTKPDIGGTYILTGGVIEFTTSGKTTGTIRSPLSYLNIEVSGSNVANSSGITTLKDGGSFKVTTGGVFENSGLRIDGTTGYQTFVMEPGATFITGVTGGLSGTDSSALYKIDNFLIDPKSTIVYNRKGNQVITPLAAYPSLLLKGPGIKTVAAGTLTIAPVADSVVIDTTVVFKISPGANVNFNNCPVIIHSSAGGTGIIGEITDGASVLLNASKVTVERFIPAKRAYRFLSSPVTAGSINDNWMEKTVNPGIYQVSNPHPGYGTNITGPGGLPSGFDSTIKANSSLFTFDYTTQKWRAVINTKTTTLSPGDAYSLLVRGDRSTEMWKGNGDSINPLPYPTSTILRTTGKLNAGTFSRTFNGASANNYVLIGNPYASPINFEKIAAGSSNIKTSYYAWDPHINRRGTYVSYNAATGRNSDAASGVTRDIQSGQAFFIQAAVDNPSFQIKENYKSTSNTAVFRNPFNSPELSIQLLLNLDEGAENNADGVVVFFDDKFTSAIGNEDSYKFTNVDENLAVNRNGRELSMEGRQPVIVTDTIPLILWQLRQKSYYLKFTASNFSTGLTAFVKDTYLHIETPVDLSSVTLFPFTVDSAVTTSFAKDRFSIVFIQGNLLPLTLIKVKAYQNDDAIEVDWIAETERNIKSYEVEKSVDGQTFDKVTSAFSKGNNGVTQAYSWLDKNTNTGNNFYRIKIIEKSGAVKYSETINVKVGNRHVSITISPNPVKTNLINLHFSDIEKGRYIVSMYNNLGQKIYNDIINHGTSSAIHTLKPEQQIPKGVYRLLISKENKTVTKTLLVE